MKALYLTVIFSVFMNLSLAAFAQEKRSQKSQQSSPKKGETALEQSKTLKLSPKAGSKSELNFEDANIEGSVKNPFSSLLNTRDQDFNKGFVKLRTQWHDQMVLGISGLSQ